MFLVAENIWHILKNLGSVSLVSAPLTTVTSATDIYRYCDVLRETKTDADILQLQSFHAAAATVENSAVNLNLIM